MGLRRSSTRTIAIALSVGLALLVLPSAAGADPGPGGHPGPVGYAGPAGGVTERAATSAASQQFTSRNWDGYVTYASSQSTDFDEVKATWVQPAVTCEATFAWTVFWVGLDGWFDNTVEQGGSEAICPVAGAPAVYALWWEMYPTNTIQTVLTINAGDQITASVRYLTASSVFVIAVTDLTTGQSFTEHERCATGLVCSRSSADVITEDVGIGNNQFLPLADYGTMTYSTASVTDTAGHSGKISDTNWLNGAVSEAGGGINYASVTPLSGTGAFRTTWLHQ